MLTQEQRTAVECPEKKILVRAGAGTGKTEVLTRRIIHLLEKDHTLSIGNFAIITFTNKATENVLYRIKKYLYFQWNRQTDPALKERYRYELEILNLAQISTIHRFCKDILEMAGPIQIGEGVYYAPGYRVDEGVLYEAANNVLNRWLSAREEKPPILRYIPIFKLRNLLLKIYQDIRSKGIPIEEAIQKTKNTCIVKEMGELRKIKQDWIALLQELASEHNRLKLNTLSTDDLLEYAYHVLKNHPELISRLQAQIRHIFVDEFQDTSLFQTEILRLICDQGDNPPHLFVVGDIKQSIYQFRGADLRSYKSMESWIAQDGKILTLKTNFRSLKPLVDYVNQTFRRIKEDERMPAFEAEDLAAHDNSDIPVADAVQVIKMDGLDPAERVARQIRELVDQGERCGDFAILFRTNRNMLDYEEALKRYGIPAQLIGAGDFFCRKEIVDIYRILNYILTPNDPVKKMEALETEIIGHHEDRLNQLLEVIRPVLHRYTVSQVLEEIYKQLQLRNYYGSCKRFQAIANLDRLKEISRSEQFREQIQLVEFVSWLGQKIMTDRDEPQAEIGDLTEDAVKLITIHKAKGLEFPYVILTELDRDLTSPGLMPEVMYCEETGIEFSIRDYVKNFHVTSSNFDAIKKRYIDDYLAEEARILYVAMTRAEKRLYLVVNENLDKRLICYQNWLWEF